MLHVENQETVLKICSHCVGACTECLVPVLLSCKNIVAHKALVSINQTFLHEAFKLHPFLYDTKRKDLGCEWECILEVISNATICILMIFVCLHFHFMILLLKFRKGMPVVVEKPLGQVCSCEKNMKITCQLSLLLFWHTMGLVWSIVLFYATLIRITNICLQWLCSMSSKNLIESNKNCWFFCIIFGWFGRQWRSCNEFWWVIDCIA